MEDDRHKDIQQLDTDPRDGSRDCLWKMVEHAQSFAVRRSDVRQWINTSLRVLTPSPPTKEHSCDFQLVPHSIDSGVPYIAVSYCWQTHDSDKGDQNVDSTVRVLQNGEIRLSRARPEIISRAMRYAISVGIDRIWIDQECIDQDDPIDKEHGIQSMDLVYYHAHQTVALLDRCVNSEDDLRSITKLMAHSFKELTATELNSKSHPLFIPLLNRIIENRWFSRSWTHQEFVCACRVVLLIAWDRKFAETRWHHWRDEMLLLLSDVEDRIDSSDTQETYAEWSISERLWSHAVTCLPDTCMGPHFDDSSEPNLSVDLTKQWATRHAKSRTLQKTGDSRAGGASTKVANGLPFSTDAVTACNSLAHTNNHRVADKVAIVANLCGYQWGINIDEVERKGLGLVSCLLAQALLNGDLSLLVRYDDDAPFSGWRPACDSTFLYWYSDGLTIYDQLHPTLIQDSCLVLEGYLCRITSYEGFIPLQAGIKQLIGRLSLPRHPLSNLNHLIPRHIVFTDCIWLILRQLSTLKHWALFEIIVAWSNPTGRGPNDIKDRVKQIHLLLQQYPDGTSYPPEFGQLFPMTSHLGPDIINLATLIAYGLPVLCAVPIKDCDDQNPCALLLIPGFSSELIFITEYYSKGEVTSWVRPTWGVRICQEPLPEEMLGKVIARFQDLGVDAGQVLSSEALEVTEYIRAAFCRDIPPGVRRMYVIR
ncbi:HET-domain-containing protein [Rhizopogon vinicolor AM-OR11-026]|uniref:HET-domain-containing protein n=1 Tax=Rhizopogon vinicolor AM-OR11-026 TaxID=1314800 RepID=A0A1B7NBR6_9AGAM|nr:HET-domain-containing protein [Rhizopogon vinicolor AM-OR11-026]